MSKKRVWNKCTWCGQFIPYQDFLNGNAITEMVLPDSAVSFETWHTTCKKCNDEERGKIWKDNLDYGFTIQKDKGMMK